MSRRPSDRFFSGEHMRKLDEHGRLTLPLSIRTILLKRRNKRWCLLLPTSEPPVLRFYPLSEWELFQKDIRDAVGKKDFQRALGESRQLKADKKGRILLKLNLRRHLKLGTARKVVVAGLFENFEVWGVTEWRRHLQRITAT